MISLWRDENISALLCAIDLLNLLKHSIIRYATLKERPFNKDYRSIGYVLNYIIWFGSVGFFLI